jgi:hypothetical protein
MSSHPRIIAIILFFGVGITSVSNIHAYLTGQAASIVIGQPDMISGAVNQGMTGSADNTLSKPNDVLVVGNKVLIADRFNHRVLIYNNIPAGNNASADVVVGQANMSGFNPNQGGTPDANTLSEPIGLYSNGTNLIVTDCGNNRVLIYHAIPTSNNTAADVVIGQPDMTTTTTACAANKMYAPQDVASDGTKLIVSDWPYCRVLIFNTIPTSNNASADVVIGQPDMISGSINQGGAPAANTLNHPTLIDYDGSNLYVTDCDNHRVLIYHGLPTVNNAAADVVLGQPDFSSNSINAGSLGANTLYEPFGIRSFGAKLFISDNWNNRLLIFNSIPTNNFASADMVIGQADMTSNAPGTTAATVNLAYGAEVTDSQLFFCDGLNHRVLIFNDQLHTPTITPTIPISPEFIQIPNRVLRVSRGDLLSLTLNLNQGTHVKIELYGVDGRRAAVILDEWQTAGSHSITHDLSSLGSGMYFLYAEAGGQSARYKIVVIR